MNAVETDHLTKYYGKTKGIEDVSFSIHEHEIFGFIGPNGAGKSTLMRCLNGLEGVNSGSINFYNTDITKLKEKEKIFFSSFHFFYSIPAATTYSSYGIS